MQDNNPTTTLESLREEHRVITAQLKNTPCQTPEFKALAQELGEINLKFSNFKSQIKKWA